jgi:hypothetical protein
MMCSYRPGDWVTLDDPDDDEQLIGVVCRVLPDGSVQAFFAEGPEIDNYTMDSYPPEWLRHTNGIGVGP